MDVTKIPNKSLYKMVVKFMKSKNFKFDNYYKSDGPMTDFALDIIDFLLNIGLIDNTYNYNNFYGEFFYMFIKLNMGSIKNENFKNFESLIRPELKLYEFVWETKLVQYVRADYKHEHESYLNKDEALLGVESLSYSGEINPGDGDQIYYDIYDSDMEYNTIENFSEIKKRKFF